MRKVFRKALVGFLICCLVFAGLPSFFAEETYQVKSVTVHDMMLYENIGGYTEDYLGDDDNWYEFYHYELNPYIEVEFTNGYCTEGYGGAWIAGFYNEYRSLEFDDPQSCDNIWGVGTYQIDATFMDYPVTFNVTIMESPIESVEVEDVEIVEYTCGHLDGYWDGGDGYTEGYFHYDVAPFVKVTLKDGTVRTGKGGVWLDGDQFDCYADLYYRVDQGPDNELSAGYNEKIPATLGGFKTEFNLSIIENPFESVTCKDITIEQCTGGYYDEDYDQDTEEYTPSYYRYSVTDQLEISVKLNDGTIIECGDDGFEYKNQNYYVYWNDKQSYENQWGIGTHKVSFSVAGLEGECNINIVESPFESIEILSIESVDVNDIRNRSWHSDAPEYTYPGFRYRINLKDGSSFVGGYTYGSKSNDDNLEVGSDQYNNPWYPGKENTLYITYGNLSTEVSVEVATADFEYIEQNGGLYITDCLTYAKDTTIPSEIKGKPVVGIIGLSSSAGVIETLTVPDSVVSLGENAFAWMNNLKTLNLGSGVADIDKDISDYCSELTTINVSANNKNLASVDGVLYNKAKDTLLVYPLGQGTEFRLPAEVTNIDVLALLQYREINLVSDNASMSYVTKDGVTYTADMKRIIRCDSSKTGVYEMPSSVVAIGQYAFASSGLSEIKVSENVTEIVYGAFYDSSNLSKVTLPKKLKTIGPMSFSGCYNLEEINIPDSVEIIDYAAFNGCESFAVDKLPSSLIRIESMAFDGNDLAEVLTLPDSLEYVGRWGMPFAKGINVKSLDSVLSMDIGDSLFYGADLYVNNQKVTKLVIPEDITEINDNAFRGCGSITEVVLHDGILSLGEGAFCDCSNLKSVTFGKGIDRIENNCFRGCYVLETVVLPENIKYIGESAFEDCSRLKNAEIKNTSAMADKTAFLYTAIDNISIADEFGINTIISGENTGVKFAESVTEIVYGQYSSYDYCTLKDIDLPDNLIKIGGHNFTNTDWYDNQNNGPVYLEHALISYKDDVFENAKLQIRNGTTTIADYALMECGNLSEITLPDGLKRIGTLAFFDCYGIESLHIPASVTEIGDYAFVGCTSLTNLTVDPKNPNYCAVDGVLYNKDKTELIWCPPLDSDNFTVPIRVQRIRNFAFGESGVKNISIASGIIKLDEYALGYSYESSYRGEEITLVNYTCLETVKCHKGSTVEEYIKNNMLTIKSENTGGDVNDDGNFNIRDATTIQKHIASIENLSEKSVARADYDFDGTVNIRDATSIQLRLAGIV